MGGAERSRKESLGRKKGKFILLYHTRLSLQRGETERQTGVLCCLLAPRRSPPPQWAWLGSWRQPVATSALRQKQNLSAALLSSTSPQRSLLLPHSFCPPLCCLEQTEAKMMQEVSIVVAYDAHVVERPGEEDTLACLVAHSKPLRTPRSVVGLSSHHPACVFLISGLCFTALQLLIWRCWLSFCFYNSLLLMVICS